MYFKNISGKHCPPKRKENENANYGDFENNFDIVDPLITAV